MKTSHIEKIPDSCLPSDEILAQLGFEKADNPTRPPEQQITLEICYPEGTCARWIVPADKEELLSIAIESHIGKPDTLT